MDIKNDFDERFFLSRHGRLHYAHHKGNGPTMILLHGLAGSIKTWSRLVQHLPDSLDMYLVDLLGHGGSEAPDIDYTLLAHYESICDLVDSVIPHKFLIMGHSYGGWVASYYAAERSGISGLILEDSSGIKEFHDERIESNPDFKEQIVRNAMELNPHEKVIRSMLDSDNTDAYLTRSRLGIIDARTLVIWGSDDSTVNVKYAEFFKSYIKGSRLEVLKGEKHTPHYTNPGAVARLVSDFARKE